MLMLGCKVVKSRKLLPLYFVLVVVVMVVNVVFPYHVTLSFFYSRTTRENLVSQNLKLLQGQEKRYDKRGKIRC